MLLRRARRHGTKGRLVEGDEAKIEDGKRMCRGSTFWWGNEYATTDCSRCAVCISFASMCLDAKTNLSESITVAIFQGVILLIDWTLNASILLFLGMLLCCFFLLFFLCFSLSLFASPLFWLLGFPPVRLSLLLPTLSVKHSWRSDADEVTSTPRTMVEVLLNSKWELDDQTWDGQFIERKRRVTREVLNNLSENLVLLRRFADRQTC